MEHIKESLFISLANLKTTESTLENDLAPLLSFISERSTFKDFAINQNPVTYASFRFLQRNIRFCCRTLFFLYTPQSSLPYYFPKPDYSALKLRQVKVLNLVNSRIRFCNPVLHRKVLTEGERYRQNSSIFSRSGETEEYRIHPHLNYPDLSPIPFDSLVYLSLAQFLEKLHMGHIVRCAYKKCMNYFITNRAEAYTCHENPFGESCINLLKLQTSVEHLGAKIRKGD